MLNRAAKRIGSEFNRIGREAGDVPVDDVLLGRVMGVMDEFLEDLPEANRLLNVLGEETISGKTLLDMSSKLGRKARNFMRNDPVRGIAVSELKDAVDDALLRAVGGENRQALSKARRQWKALLMLEQKGVIRSPTEGDVSPNVLANAVERMDRARFQRGTATGELADIARAFPAAVGDSGTATRLSLPLATGGAGAVLAGQQLLEGDPVGAAAMGALPLLALTAAGRGYNNPIIRSYLEQGIPLLGREMPRQAVQGLLGRAGAAGGLLASQ